MRLKEGVDTVLCWRKEATGDKNGESWHEIDLADVKTIEPKGQWFHMICIVCAWKEDSAHICAVDLLRFQ